MKSPKVLHSPPIFSPAKYDARYPTIMTPKKQRVTSRKSMNSPSKMSLNKVSSAATRQPLILKASPAENKLPVFRRQEQFVEQPSQESNIEVDRMCQLLEKHDHLLQVISEKVEKLLSIKSREDDQRPKTSTVEAMTSVADFSGNCATEQRVFKSPGSSVKKGRRGIMTQWKSITTTLCLEDACKSIERERFCAQESEDTFYNRMMNNVNDILLLQSSDRSLEETKMSPPKQDLNPGHETIYIKNLASKYLSEKTIAFNEGIHRQDFKIEELRMKILPTSPGVSFSTQNYLKKYDLNTARCPRQETTKRQLLDIDKIRVQPKFL